MKCMRRYSRCDQKYRTLHRLNDVPKLTIFSYFIYILCYHDIFFLNLYQCILTWLEIHHNIIRLDFFLFLWLLQILWAMVNPYVQCVLRMWRTSLVVPWFYWTCWKHFCYFVCFFTIVVGSIGFLDRCSKIYSCQNEEFHVKNLLFISICTE